MREPCPVTLDELIRAVARQGRLHHLSLVKCRERVGCYQASYKRPDTNGYAVHISDDPVEAVQTVLGPLYGHPWSEVLGNDEDPHVMSRLNAEPADDFDEDDLI